MKMQWGPICIEATDILSVGLVKTYGLIRRRPGFRITTHRRVITFTSLDKDVAAVEAAREDFVKLWTETLKHSGVFVEGPLK